MVRLFYIFVFTISSNFLFSQKLLLPKVFDPNKNGPDTIFFDSGNIALIRNYKDGLLHGQSLRFDGNGQLSSEEYYKLDQLDSINKSWYPNGSIQHISFYNEGELDGKIQYWDSTGIKYVLTIKELCKKLDQEEKQTLEKDYRSNFWKSYKKSKKRRNSR